MVSTTSSLVFFPMEIFDLYVESKNIGLLFSDSVNDASEIVTLMSLAISILGAIPQMSGVFSHDSTEEVFRAVSRAYKSSIVFGAVQFFMLQFAISFTISDFFKSPFVWISFLASWLSVSSVLDGLSAKKVTLGEAILVILCATSGFVAMFLAVLFARLMNNEQVTWGILAVILCSYIAVSLIANSTTKHYFGNLVCQRKRLRAGTLSRSFIISCLFLFVCGLCAPALTNSPSILSVPASSRVISTASYVEKYNIALNMVEREVYLPVEGKTENKFAMRLLFSYDPNESLKIKSASIFSPQNHPVLYASAELEDDIELIDVLSNSSMGYSFALSFEANGEFVPKKGCERNDDGGWLIWEYEEINEESRATKATLYSNETIKESSYVRQYNADGTFSGEVQVLNSSGELTETYRAMYINNKLISYDIEPIDSELVFTCVVGDNKKIEQLIIKSKGSDFVLTSVGYDETRSSFIFGEAVQKDGSKINLILDDLNTLDDPNNEWKEITLYTLNDSGESVPVKLYYGIEYLEEIFYKEGIK